MFEIKCMEIIAALLKLSQNEQNSFPKAACCARPGPGLPAQRAVLPQIVLSAVGIAAAWGG